MSIEAAGPALISCPTTSPALLLSRDQTHCRAPPTQATARSHSTHLAALLGSLVMDTVSYESLFLSLSLSISLCLSLTWPASSAASTAAAGSSILGNAYMAPSTSWYTRIRVWGFGGVGCGVSGLDLSAIGFTLVFVGLSVGCRVQGAGRRMQGAGCRVQGAGCRRPGRRRPGWS